MSISLPSRAIYSFDVPEVKSFSAEFRYNFFTPDERVVELSRVPNVYTKKSSTELGAIADDEAQLDFASLKVPRWVKLSWRLPQIRFASATQRQDESSRHAFPLPVSRDYISANLDKVIYEDRMSSDAFVALVTQDANIDVRLYNLVSGSVELEKQISVDNATQKALVAQELTPPTVNPEFMTKVLAQPLQHSGVTFDENIKLSKTPEYLAKLRKVAVVSQLSTKCLKNLVDTTTMSPWSPTYSSFVNVSKEADAYVSNAKISLSLSEGDYKTFIPFVSVIKQERGNSQPTHKTPQLVGYIINKQELLLDGTVRLHPDIIIDTPRVANALDIRVKYGAVYQYAVRAVFALTLTAIDEETKIPYNINVLIASRPSQKEFVTCDERVAPPPPADFKLIWDYDKRNQKGRLGSLMLTWSFPPTSQRDIKKFHILRRKSVEHPFEVLRVFDFDDSEIKTPDTEEYFESAVTKNANPQLYYYDEEFTKESKYIYAVSCQDAHGYISGYSAQFEVWFDAFKNSLQKRLVSSSGAPRPYPNLFLNTDLFVDTIHVRGESSKNFMVCFDPEYYVVHNDKNQNVSKIATQQTGGKYRLQFINVDNQKEGHIDIVIDDSSRVIENA